MKQIPIEIIKNDILSYMCLIDIYKLSTTNTLFRDFVKHVMRYNINFYKKQLHKGAKKSLENVVSIISFDFALAKTCQFCLKRFRGTFNKPFGVYGHRKCIGEKLIHTSYVAHNTPIHALEKCGIPLYEHEEYILGIYSETITNYFIWKRYDESIPKQWTLEWLMKYNPQLRTSCVPITNDKKRKSTSAIVKRHAQNYNNNNKKQKIQQNIQKQRH